METYQSQLQGSNCHKTHTPEAVRDLASRARRGLPAGLKSNFDLGENAIVVTN